MFTAGELEGAAYNVERTFAELETRIMDDIVRRIRINGEITRAADWQIHRLHELGASDAAVKKYIAGALKISEKQVDQLYIDVLKTGYARDAKIYGGTGVDRIPLEENTTLQRLIETVENDTNKRIRNDVTALAVAKRQNGNVVNVPLADYCRTTFDGAMYDIASGAFDYQTVLKQVTRELCDSGIRVFDEQEGRYMRMVPAVRSTVMTSVSQITAAMNEQNAKILGTELFEVTWHGGARPEHQVWQGKVYTKKELETVCGLGAVDGLCGRNCYHDYYPFVPGVSERMYTDGQIKKMNRKENTPVQYNGRQYTKYQALQHQRALERDMRAQRQRIRLLEIGGADEKLIILARGRYRATSAAYTSFSTAMGIPQQRERVTVDGLGNIGVGKI